MKRISTIFLQAVIVLVGITAVAFLLWEPHVEGVNAHATFFQAYFDFFVAYVYIASIPFFVALYHTFRVLTYVRQDTTFSQATAKSLRTIKFCALAIIGFVAVSVLLMIHGNREDRPAGTFMRILIAFPSLVVAAAAAMLQGILQTAVDTKTKNDLSA